MRIYEIVLDGQLAADLSDSVRPFPGAKAGRPSSAFPPPDPATLARVLGASSRSASV